MTSATTTGHTFGNGASTGTAATGNLTGMLKFWRSDNAADRNRLMNQIYPELTKIAARALGSQPPHATFEATDLVNEAWLKLSRQRNARWRNRSHFYAIAARIIRRIVVDHTRRRLSEKRGGRAQRLDVDDVTLAAPGGFSNWLELDEALTRLNDINTHAAQIVELRYLTGLSIEDTAEAMEIGTATVGRHWRFARAWLRTRLSPTGGFS
ncbi:MAG: ECF-type sigma factor [Lysobacterales bacterium]